MSVPAILLIMTFFSSKGQPVNDSVIMGQSYVNDIFYSFKNGTVHTAPRLNWDIAFQSTIWSATILTNGASDVKLYTYPNADTSGWSSVDTTGMLGWKLLYNSDQTWDEGAFNRNQSGHPDYGWGKYNLITHDVIGDSIYVIKGIDGTYRKLWIIKKNSLANTYYIRYANLDGTGEKYDTLDNNPYLNKNFTYYSFGTDGLIDREPDIAAWDILFTKYIDIQPNGMPYPVTGVLNNTMVYANRFHPVAMDFTDWLSKPMDSTLQPIGYDWKTLAGMSYVIEDSLIYFVHTATDDIFKLYFTGFSGSMSGGKIYFTKELISASGVSDDRAREMKVTVSPNPVVDRMVVRLGEMARGPLNYKFFDLRGRLVLSGQAEAFDGQAEIKIPAGSLGTGMHLMVVTMGNASDAIKVMAQ